MRTLYEVGEPDHPVVDAVKVVPESCVPLGERVTVPPVGTPGVTVAVFEDIAEVEPLAFVAVTRQRIGLRYPRVKKLEGGV